MRLKKCVHNKTGNIYYAVCECIECTNSRENLVYIVYMNLDGEFFCREKEEFLTKFTEA